MTVPQSGSPSVALTSVSRAVGSSVMILGTSTLMISRPSSGPPDASPTRLDRNLRMGLLSRRNSGRRPSFSSTAAPPLRLNAAPSAGRISGKRSKTVTSSKP